MHPALYRPLSLVFRTPPYIILFASDRCWLRCRHCWYTDRWKRAHLTGPRLTFDELERLAGSLDRVAFLTFAGGEAFRRPDLVELALMFHGKARFSRYDVPSSGFDTDQVVSQTAGLLERLPGVPLRVSISLDGTEATHDHIRGVSGAYRNALRSVAALRRLAQRHDHFDVSVLTTISRHNQDQLREISGVVRRINPGGEWMVNLARGISRDPAAVEVDPDRYFEAHRIIEQWQHNGSYRGHRGHRGSSWISAKNATRREVIRRILAQREPGGGCAAGTLVGVISVDGTVSPCEMLELPLGNLRSHDMDLAALWRSPAAQRARAWIHASRCICTHECFLSISLLLQPRHWPTLIKQRIKLQRSQSLLLTDSLRRASRWRSGRGSRR
jgi:MoaA/NifB/PqqE/SkfB family radical SAM enzyme